MASRQKGPEYQYARCRTLRHSWDAVGPVIGRRRRTWFGTLVTFRCEHCGTLRYDIVSRLTGEVLSRDYDYPDDYAHERQTSREWRASFLDEIDNSMMIELEQESP